MAAGGAAGDHRGGAHWRGAGPVGAGAECPAEPALEASAGRELESTAEADPRVPQCPSAADDPPRRGLGRHLRRAAVPWADPEGAAAQAQPVGCNLDHRLSFWRRSYGPARPPRPDIAGGYARLRDLAR